METTISIDSQYDEVLSKLRKIRDTMLVNKIPNDDIVNDHLEHLESVHLEYLRATENYREALADTLSSLPYFENQLASNKTI